MANEWSWGDDQQVPGPPSSATPGQPTGTPSGLPAYGQYATGPTGGGPSGGPGNYPPGLWVPKPGIIPLRPLRFGDIVNGAFGAIRANPAVMFGMSFLVMLVVAAIGGVFSYYTERQLLAQASADANLEELWESILPSTLPMLVPLLLALLATTVLSGLIVLAVSRAVLGRVLGPGAVWKQVRGRIPALLGLTVIVYVLQLLPAAVIIALLAGLATLMRDSGWDPGAALFLLVVLGLGGLAASAYLSIRLLFAAPVLILEKTTVGAAIKRSLALTRRSFWRLFGIIIVTGILAGIVSGFISSFITLPVLAFMSISSDPSQATPPAAVAVLYLGQALASTFTVPFTAATTALLYIDQRIRRESLDVELARAAQQ
ncbi:MAG: glycerophosphoryl diester phosphodiesterase membrane domain-containing protein [Buchananella hordeovulneris]|nr:glycerophosphoryl diester phosphodiesterase membrane domain-containing protein [Buchananella hordeovulneris]MDO5079812.1 glycerophosphoryl diester phosphodiesterase membrane domain-containing protein [Buchananella hordeovulneris]